MPKAQLRVLKRSDDAINCCAWHPNQKTVAVGSDDGRLTLYDVTKGRELRGGIQRKNAVSTVAFAFDGSLAVGGADGLVAIYDKRGKLVRELAAARGMWLGGEMTQAVRAGQKISKIDLFVTSVDPPIRPPWESSISNI